MATSALGPTMAGGPQPIVENGYELIYYPDVNNDALQAEGKQPVFYWLPNYVHLARKDGRENGDLMFDLLRFAGIQSSDTTVGVTEGSREVAGGVLGFTVTSAPPDSVLNQSQQKIIQMYQGKTNPFWGIRTNRAPIFRPVEIMSNVTTVSNLSPNAQGGVTVPAPALPAAPGAPGVAAGPGPSRFIEVAVPPMISQKGFSPRQFGAARDGSSSSNLDPWYWNMQGQGNGSIDPMGQHAYSALLGAYPTAIMWAAFHGAYTPINVSQALKIKFWVPTIEITIKGNWERVFTHFSAHATGHYLWFSADIKAEMNKMRQSGIIEVDVKIDTTIPGGEQIAKYVDEKTNLVFDKFMDAAKKVIFDPPQPEVQAAQASSSGGLFGLWGGGVALKVRRDETTLDLYYHEKRQMAYLQDHVISSSLEGLYDEIKANPEAERKYFQTVTLDDWPRKLGRVVKPIVNWPKPEQNWAGEPVAFVSAQFGYPNTKGEIMWQGRMFQKTDPADVNWSFGITQKQLADVSPPPAGWSPDKTYVKRTIHMMEPPDAIENPYVRVQIADNEIELDPGPNGSLMNDITIEVRADEAGRIKAGPVALNVDLENAKQNVEVTFQAIDENGNDLPMFAPVKFSWGFDNQQIPRFWSLFTADKTVRSIYKYQVRVIVKGSLFTKGMEWKGPWVRSIGNGPMMISVPTPEDPGVVVTRDFPGFPAETNSSTPPTGVSASPANGTTAPPAGARSEMPVPEPALTYRVDAPRTSQPAPPSRRSVPATTRSEVANTGNVEFESWRIE